VDILLLLADIIPKHTQWPWAIRKSQKWQLDETLPLPYLIRCELSTVITDLDWFVSLDNGITFLCIMYLVCACYISIYRKFGAMTVLRKCYLMIDPWNVVCLKDMLPGLLNDKMLKLYRKCCPILWQDTLMILTPFMQKDSCNEMWSFSGMSLLCLGKGNIILSQCRSLRWPIHG